MTLANKQLQLTKAIGRRKRLPLAFAAELQDVIQAHDHYG
jgi:hypothetical protein